MKNFTSVLMLWARRSIWQVLAIIAVMAAAETALFYFLALLTQWNCIGKINLF